MPWGVTSLAQGHLQLKRVTLKKPCQSRRAMIRTESDYEPMHVSVSSPVPFYTDQIKGNLSVYSYSNQKRKPRSTIERKVALSKMDMDGDLHEF